MSNAQQPFPVLYREAAQQVRQLAQRVRLTDVRGDLLQLSASYERIAASVEAAIRLGAPGYPHGEILPIAPDYPPSDGGDHTRRALSEREEGRTLKRGRASPLAHPALFRKSTGRQS
jgi:hypothetical protein